MAKTVSNLKATAAAFFMTAAAALPGGYALADTPQDTQQETILLAANDTAETFSSAASGTTAAALTDEQLARLSVIGESRDYALDKGYGHIGVSALHGPDFPHKTAEEVANGFALGIGRNFKLPAAGFAGDNGEKATELYFSYLVPPRNSDESPSVETTGPHNLDEALVVVRGVANSVHGIVEHTGVNVESVSFEP